MSRPRGRNERRKNVDTPSAEPAAGAAYSAPGLDVPRLCARVRGGDAAAFEVLYRAWYGRVANLARAATRRDESFCLDATHDVMVRVAERVPVLADERALAAWMCRCTLSVCMDALRRESRRAKREASAARGEVTRAEDTPAINAAQMAAMMDSLNLHDYDLVMSRLAHDLTLRQAGLSAGVSADAAHGRIRRSLESLRRLAGSLMP